MRDLLTLPADVPVEQQAIQAKCLHPTGTFVKFQEAALEQSLSERFEQQVVQSPDNLAVKSEVSAVTYHELNQAANRVARAILAKHGKGPEPLGLLFETGVQALAAIFGTLKAGKFYVPLDPSFPPGRISSIIEDSGTTLLVTNSQNFRLASELAGEQLDLLDIDTIDANVSAENLDLAVSPDDLACVIYTSGSTGHPKGVMHNHRALLHWAMIHVNNLHITPHDRLTLLHSWSVPSCIHHLLGSLLSGAALLPFDPRLSAGKPLARWLVQEQVTMYHSVPMVFRQLAAALTGEEAFPHLRVITLSGAPMTRSDVALYARHFPSACVFMHTIGTTETGWLRCYFIDNATQIVSTTVPIGYAMQDIGVMLLDEAGRAVGCGQVGEMAIKSRYLALGYWRKPELTQAKFIPGVEGEERVYLSGDLGRMEADGCLFHLGRKDFQVKVRGYRVEIDEVEIALLDHPAVMEVAAVGRQVPSGDTQLVAYVVPAAGQTPTITELRGFLGTKLPDYMIPSTFVMLRALPLTPNAKLDYRALPAPERLRPALDAAYVAPKTQIEQRIATVWQEVLGIEQVGLYDNFFDLGGQSLLLGQVQSKLQAIFQQDLPIVDLFQHPTIDALVAYIGSKDPAPAAVQPGDDLRQSVHAGRNRLKQLSQRRQQTREE